MAYQHVLSALADPTRRQILESLREAPLSVGQITSRATVSRPAVSQHLKVLESASLVSVQPVGTRRLYSFNQRGLAELRSYLDSYREDVLNAYAAKIESSQKKENKE